MGDGRADPDLGPRSRHTRLTGSPLLICCGCCTQRTRRIAGPQQDRELEDGLPPGRE
jgi:hypothetical protein